MMSDVFGVFLTEKKKKRLTAIEDFCGRGVEFEFFKYPAVLVNFWYSLKELGLLDSVSILQIRPGMFKEVFQRFLAHFLIL
jgi:hypothetical protein